MSPRYPGGLSSENPSQHPTTYRNGQNVGSTYVLNLHLMHTEIFCYVLLQLCMPLEIVLSNMLYIHWTLDEWLIRVACLVQVTSDGVAYVSIPYYL